MDSRRLFWRLPPRSSQKKERKRKSFKRGGGPFVRKGEEAAAAKPHSKEMPSFQFTFLHRGPNETDQKGRGAGPISLTFPISKLCTRSIQSGIVSIYTTSFIHSLWRSGRTLSADFKWQICQSLWDCSQSFDQAFCLSVPKITQPRVHYQACFPDTA